MAEGGIPGRRKAAMLMLSLGRDASVSLFKHLDVKEVETLTVEIAKISKVTPSEQEGIIEEFFKISKAQSYISKGGVQYAREILEQALGKERANKILSGLTTSFQVMPFDFLHKSPPEILSVLFRMNSRKR